MWLTLTIDINKPQALQNCYEILNHFNGQRNKNVTLKIHFYDTNAGTVKKNNHICLNIEKNVLKNFSECFNCTKKKLAKRKERLLSKFPKPQTKMPFNP